MQQVPSLIRNVAAAALEDLVATDSHLELAASLIARYQWPEGKAEELGRALARVSERRRDENFYLAVVGEFASGKSALINALLRDDLLPSSVVQATTAAVTVLRYGVRPGVEVELRNGERRSFVLAGPIPVTAGSATPVTDLSEPLARYVADEETARTVARVTVYGASPILEDGLVLLDTPGTNVNNPRHVEVATWAIHEACDAAVVLIPANIPLSRDFADFLKAHLSGSLHRCLFLVTMIDRIALAERESLLTTVRQRLIARLGVEEPVILPISAASVLDEISDRYELAEAYRGEPERRRLIEEFQEAEGRIYEEMERQRVLIVLERIASLLGRLYDELAEGIAALERKHAEEHRALEANRIADLAAYAAARKEEHGGALEGHLASIPREARERIRLVRQQVQGELKAALDEAKNDVNLRKVMTDTASDRLKAAQTELAVSFSELLGRARAVTLSEVAEFERDFLTLYRSLASLGGRSMLENLPAETVQGLDQQWLESATKAISGLAVSDSKLVDRAMLSGIIAGAAAGSVIAPGIGTLIGAFAGLIGMGNLVIPDADKQRAKYQSRVDEETGKIFAQAESSAGRMVEEVVRRAKDEVSSVIDRYVERYDALVQRMIAEEKQKSQELEARRGRVRQDAEDLAQRRKALDEARSGLRRIREI